MTKLWETAGASLANRLTGAGGPALVFWVSVFAVYAGSSGGGRTVDAALARLAAAPTATTVLLIVLALLAVVSSGLVVERLVEPALVLLTGRWPRVLAWPSWWLIARTRRKVEKDGEEFARLAEKDPDDPALGRIDARLRRVPGEDSELRPTPLGNTLRAAERAPALKYGLDPAVVWARLWLLLPEATRTEFSQARLRVTGAVAAAVWSLLFAGTAILDPRWASGGPVLAVLVVAFWLPPRLEAYADLLEASFDVHRHLLYEAVRWPLPGKPAEEPELGRELGTYLLRGSDAEWPTFTTSRSEP